MRTAMRRFERALRKRSLISFLPLARCWPERRGTLPPGQTLLWIEALGQEAMLLE